MSKEEYAKKNIWKINWSLLHENPKWYPRVVSLPCTVFITVFSRWSLQEHRWGRCGKIKFNMLYSVSTLCQNSFRTLIIQVLTELWHGVEKLYNILNYISPQHPYLCSWSVHLDKTLIKCVHGTETALGYHFRFSCNKWSFTLSTRMLHFSPPVFQYVSVDCIHSYGWHVASVSALQH